MTEISRRQFAVYLAAVVLVVLLGGRALRVGNGADAAGTAPIGGFTAQAGPGGTATVGGAAGATGTSAAGGGVDVSRPEEPLLVDVAGAVRRPGVYELVAGARIRDALQKAGGGRAGADLEALNLAAKVTDGQQVLVARRQRGATSAAAVAGASGAVAGATSAPSATPVGALVGAPVNINQADATQLEALNGVGPAIAAKIVDYRTQNGPFRTADDLAQVSGIGPKKLEAMRAQVVT